MDFVTSLPVVGILNYNAITVLTCRLTKKAEFFPTHKEASDFEIALAYNKWIFPENGIPKVIISDREPKFSSEFWTSLHQLMGSKLSSPLLTTSKLIG